MSFDNKEDQTIDAHYNMYGSQNNYVDRRRYKHTHCAVYGGAFYNPSYSGGSLRSMPRAKSKMLSEK
jgi:hypothetical protein